MLPNLIEKSIACLQGTFLMTQTFVNAMVENNVSNGSVINIASIVGRYGNIGQANYSASKAGVEALSKTASKEFGKFGIRCNAVVPGIIKSPMSDAVPDHVKAKFMGAITLKRFGEPIGELGFDMLLLRMVAKGQCFCCRGRRSDCISCFR